MMPRYSPLLIRAIMWFACAAHPQEKPKPEIIALIDPPAPAAKPSIAFDGACRW
ncbi:MAG TPA: hypothetical protein VN765_11170 [Candidatus Acidoferrum sp.]|nr:hypothetical protein [Candidatus Acidoferrum sp.]